MKKIFILLAFISFSVSAQINQNNDWRKTGNSVNSNTNYIGTNDNRSFNVKTNNTLAWQIDSNRIARLFATSVTSTINGSFYYRNGALLGWVFYHRDITGNTNNFSLDNGVCRLDFYGPAVTGAQYGWAAITSNTTGFALGVNGNAVMGVAATTVYINQKTRIGSAVLPTAWLHINGGTAAATTAPLKFTGGTNMTITEPGAMEFSSNVLYFTPNATRYEVGMYLKGSAVLDFPNTLASNSSTLNITVTGASVGDPVILGVDPASTPPITQTGSYYAIVTATNTVTVYFNNTNTLAAYDPASGTFKVAVNKN